MKSVVFDTSVVAAWYLDESFSLRAREWQHRLLAEEVQGVVPSLHYDEFANVLRTLSVRRTLDRELAEELWSLHLQAPLRTMNPARSTLLSTALDYAATAYDAVYISLALELDAPLVTAERTTTPWVVKLGERIASVR